MDENLIGYLLDALDEPERRAVEAHLGGHPEAQARLETLRRALLPLQADAEAPEPPARLALTTLARIAEQQCRGLPPAPPLRRNLAPWRGPRRSDMLAAAVLLILVGGLTFPWVLHQLGSAEVYACKANMRLFWEAMQKYGDNNEGKFPRVPERGPNSFAAMFVPTLNDGYLNPDKHLACGAASEPSEKPATLDQLASLKDKDPTAFQNRARHLAGNYAYSLGYHEKDKEGLSGSCRTDNPYQPILADHRPDHCGIANSPNHGGQGQNVLFTDGHVRFCSSPNVGIGGDDIYLNRENKVEAGVCREDAVLGAGETSPTARDE
jgi:prepilin-type processing-associated H-X9-DG protein